MASFKLRKNGRHHVDFRINKRFWNIQRTSNTKIVPFLDIFTGPPKSDDLIHTILTNNLFEVATH